MIGANMLLSKLDRLLFFTPETILNSRKWRYFIQEKCADRLKALAFDEAHTVKMW